MGMFYNIYEFDSHLGHHLLLTADVKLIYLTSKLSCIMSIENIILQAGHLPHLLSKVEPATKSVYRKKYRKMKKLSGVSILTSVSSTTLIELAKDIITSKLKARGYRTIFLILGGPVIQVIAVPFYVFSKGTRLRNLAIACMAIGSEISRGTVEISTWFWIFLDLLLFGEYVSTTEGENWMLIRNETDSKIAEVVNSIGANN